MNSSSVTTGQFRQPFSWYAIGLFVICFLIAAFLLHSRHFDAPPSKIHTWVQSDHYALAIGFIDNGFNFLKPQTYSLSHEFPASSEVTNPKGITSSDFPIFQYMVAGVMSALGSTEPWVFRAMSLLFSFVALSILFGTLRGIKGNSVAAITCAFVMFQPIYTFYQTGFHVSIAANSMFIVATCCLLRQYHYGLRSMAFAAIALLTLAALMRFTLIIFLLALLCAWMLVFIMRRERVAELIASALGVLLVALYFLYNRQLAAEYGSVFLAAPILPESVSQLVYHILRIAASYSRGLVPFIHLFVLVLAFVLYNSATIHPKRMMREWLAWLIFAALGTACFTVLMSWSIGAHDYYALDTWQPVLLILFIYLIYPINIDTYKPQVPLLVAALSLGMFSVALEQQYRKYDNRLRATEPELLLQEFSSSAMWLNSFSMKGSNVVVIAGPGWNTPLIGWRHSAFRVAADFHAQVPKAVAGPQEYIVTHNRHFNAQVLSNCSNFPTAMEKLGTNGLVSVWKKTSSVQPICKSVIQEVPNAS